MGCQPETGYVSGSAHFVAVGVASSILEPSSLFGKGGSSFHHPSGTMWSQICNSGDSFYDASQQMTILTYVYE